MLCGAADMVEVRQTRAFCNWRRRPMDRHARKRIAARGLLGDEPVSFDAVLTRIKTAQDVIDVSTDGDGC